MKLNYGDVIKKATRLTREQNVLEATRVLLRAVSGKAAAAPDQKPAIEQLPGSGTGARPKPAQRKASAGPSDASAQPAPAARAARRLGEVVNLLRRGGLAIPVAPPLRDIDPTHPDLVADGAAYVTRRFECPAGERSYRLYVPKNSGLGKRPLILMLHGCTQNPDDFAIGTGMNRLADENGFIVAYPAQTARDNPMACWNWFKPGDQMRDKGEPAILAGMTRAIIAEWDIDPRRVYVAGLSAGGAMADILSAIYPDIYAASGIHSGLAYGAAADESTAFAAMRGISVQAGSGHAPKRRGKRKGGVRCIVFHGDADHKVHPSNANRIVADVHAALDGAVSEKRFEGSAGGRAFARTLITNASGDAQLEFWSVSGLGHAWSGGHPSGSHTDPAGPDASREMVRFFLS